VPRFFLDHDQIGSSTAVLTGAQASHAKVLRLRSGDIVTLCDGTGMDYICRVTEISSNQVALAIEKTMQSITEAAVFASVYMAFAKGDKIEHVIQKATELGANEIVLYPSSRCVAKNDEKTLEKKLVRWRKIAFSAAEQSGRGRIPDVLAVESFNQAVSRASAADLSILFYENERSRTLSDALRDSYSTISLMTGPEGGFSIEEVLLATDAGLQICTLGSRILRCETAPLCALSAVMFASGEF